MKEKSINKSVETSNHSIFKISHDHYNNYISSMQCKSKTLLKQSTGRCGSWGKHNDVLGDDAHYNIMQGWEIKERIIKNLLKQKTDNLRLTQAYQ